MACIAHSNVVFHFVVSFADGQDQNRHIDMKRSHKPMLDDQDEQFRVDESSDAERFPMMERRSTLFQFPKDWLEILRAHMAPSTNERIAIGRRWNSVQKPLSMKELRRLLYQRMHG